MSGSEFERENSIANALSMVPDSKPEEPLHEGSWREHDWRPAAEGLYDPSLEKDSCGVGGADPRAGDGAGILVQIPHAFFERKAAEIGFQLPKPDDYAVGALFMPKETAWRKVIKSIIADQIRDEGF